MTGSLGGIDGVLSVYVVEFLRDGVDEFFVA